MDVPELPKVTLLPDDRMGPYLDRLTKRVEILSDTALVADVDRTTKLSERNSFYMRSEGDAPPGFWLFDSFFLRGTSDGRRDRWPTAPTDPGGWISPWTVEFSVKVPDRVFKRQEFVNSLFNTVLKHLQYLRFDNLLIVHHLIVYRGQGFTVSRQWYCKMSRISPLRLDKMPDQVKPGDEMVCWRNLVCPNRPDSVVGRMNLAEARLTWCVLTYLKEVNVDWGRSCLCNVAAPDEEYTPLEPAYPWQKKFKG